MKTILTINMTTNGTIIITMIQIIPVLTLSHLLNNISLIITITIKSTKIKIIGHKTKNCKRQKKIKMKN